MAGNASRLRQGKHHRHHPEWVRTCFEYAGRPFEMFGVDLAVLLFCIYYELGVGVHV